MKATRIIALSAMVCGLVAGLSAYACHVSGQVRCPNGTVYPGVRVWVNGTNTGGTIQTWVLTDSEGKYDSSLPDLIGNYWVSLDPTTLPGDATIPPAVQIFVTAPPQFFTDVDFEVDSSLCDEGVAWFTGGGAKIDPLLGIATAHATTKSGKGGGGGPELSFGGNVYPGCSPTAGDGGSWNHVDRALNLHFHGTTIVVTKVGNVPGIPPGSTSPKTPFNFLECTGTGWLKGLQGNKTNLPLVYFYARFEDHNEPGSKGSNDGTLIDQYYLRVYDGSGNTLLLVSGDPANPLNIVPIPITDGNFQLHISSCDNPPTP